MKKNITVVVPVFNEGANITPLFESVDAVFVEIAETYQYKILFVDDGSTDKSLEQIKILAKKYGNVEYLQLSRNFGKEAALSAGIAEAQGDAVILIDADLQHPPAVIKDLIIEWENGADTVVGVRKNNPDEGFLRRFGSRGFSYIMRMVSDIPVVSGATDFRLLGRPVVDEFNRLTEHGRMARGLIDWLGFKRVYVSFDSDSRNTGVAQYGYGKLIKLAFSAILSHSLLPLRLATYLGVPITIFAGGFGFSIIVEQFIFNDPWLWEISPIVMMAVMILFINGLVLICLGLMSLYVEKIHQETINRPLFIIKKNSRSVLSK